MADASDVKKLRELTGAGVMDAKNALTETGDDFEKAVEVIKKKGLAKADKKAEREINLGELAQSQLIALSKAMPLILEDFVRLDYSLFKPELFECAKAFGSRVEEAVKERGLESRERVAEVLKD